MSTLIPSTTTPFEAKACWNWLSEGISSMQGGHQVAQKFNTRSLPPKLAGLITRPLSVLMEKAGAVSPTPTILLVNAVVDDEHQDHEQHRDYSFQKTVDFDAIHVWKL